MDPRLALENGDETEVSRILLGTHPAFAQEREAPLFGCVYDEGALWRADDAGVWRQIEGHEVRNRVRRYSGMPKPSSNGGESGLKVNAGFAAGVLKAIEDMCAAPGFFNSGRRGIAFRDKFLVMDRNGTTALEPLTEKHRCRFALDFDYDPNAPPPAEFLSFLRSIWGDDTEQINVLLEWIGYLLSERTDLQKILLLIGPPRSGKGTILRLIQKIFGHAATSFKVCKIGNDRWMLGSLMGKTVAYDPDVRRTSIHDSESAAVEALNSISGEDFVTCERKYEHALRTKLGARLMLCTNPPFAIRDVGGALSTRLLVCEMTRSFLGKEDTTLDAKLASELPGIVRLAVLALQVLSARGRFVEPASSAETRKQVEQGEKPIRAWIEDRCELDPNSVTERKAAYADYKEWCVEAGVRPNGRGQFGAELERENGIRFYRPGSGNRKRGYQGIRLTTGLVYVRPGSASSDKLNTAELSN